MKDYNYSEYFKEPKESAKIWRYLDLSKFISLLDRKALFFVRQDKLSKDDPFEGFTPKPYLEEIARDSGAVSNEDIEKIENAIRKAKKFTFVNCWHINEYESAAMWKLYLKCNEGVAIQSTYERLMDCTKSPDQKIDVGIGPIKYIDYNQEGIPKDNILYIAFHKWICYEYEKELRASFQILPIKNGFLYNPSLGEVEEEIDFERNLPWQGKAIPVDLDILIENIYLSPWAPGWFGEVVSSVTEKYGLNKEIKPSMLTRNLYNI